jgi:thiol-disulfide isomerase/thioredoxin
MGVIIIWCSVCEAFFEIEFDKLKEIDEEYDKKIHELHDKRRVIISDVVDYKELEELARKWKDFLKFREALEKIKRHRKEYEDIIKIDFGD